MIPRSVFTEAKDRSYAMLAGMLVWLFMVVPGIPIRNRYLILMMAVMSFFGRKILRAPGALWIAGYTLYVCVLGVLVVYYFGDGDYGDALNPLKTLALCAFVLFFAAFSTLRGFLLLVGLIMAGSLSGMVLDVYFGPAERWLPFALKTEGSLTFGTTLQSVERFGGFTSEASVVGGMTAMFMIVLVCVFYLQLENRRSLVPFRHQVLVVGAIAMGLVTFYLSKTKSGLFVAGPALLMLLGGALLTNRSARRSFKLVVAVLVLVAGAGVPLGYKIVQDPDWSEYMRAEANNFYLLYSRGLDRTEGAGLKTRIESMKLAVYSLPTRPFGGGQTEGRFYTEHGLAYVEPTEEMDQFYGRGRYNGYKGAIFNIMSEGGLIGLGVLFAFYVTIYRTLQSTPLLGTSVVAWTLITALILLGVSVEVLPYWEIVVMILGLAVMIRREIIITGAGGRRFAAPLYKRRPLQTRHGNTEPSTAAYDDTA